jgi:hypothetical protein
MLMTALLLSVFPLESWAIRKVKLEKSASALNISDGMRVRIARFSAWPNFADVEHLTVSGVSQSRKVNILNKKDRRQLEKEYATRREMRHAIASSKLACL